MDLLLLFLLTSTVLVQGYDKQNDPNDEPFLPIYPVYPYSPKLIKRGVADRENAAQLSAELYASKAGAKDSYGASLNANHPRDPYYLNRNPCLKVSSSPNYGYYGSLPYSYPTAYSPATYAAPSPSYGVIPYSASYPNYYYQSTYYYPEGYYSKPLFYTPPPPPPPPPPSSLPAPVTEYPNNAPYADSEISGKNREKYSNDEQNYKDRGPNQFIDGANYISDSSKDLESQSSSYKTSAHQNQLMRWDDSQLKNLPLPRTTYRVVSVAGQPVGPDYPLPAPYAKAQQLEDMMRHAWGKAYVQNLQQANEDRYPAQEASKKVVARMNTDQYSSQNDRRKDAQFAPAIAKTALTYVASNNGMVNSGRTTDQEFQMTPNQLVNVKAYPVPLKPGVYQMEGNPVAEQTRTNAYENFEGSSNQGGQSYEGSFSSQADDKQQQNYENDSGQGYQNQPFATVQTSREYNYPNNFNPPQMFSQQPSRLYKNN
ncbi:uncharacterized protein LOC143430655 [Xylocopa sonorina]|uniref:uncharacterized protein LOC143430655 n=1 Tax=Xylocopa sonorina TaxID=1818115 RepID=UPI00403AA531